MKTSSDVRARNARALCRLLALLGAIVIAVGCSSTGRSGTADRRDRAGRAPADGLVPGDGSVEPSAGSDTSDGLQSGPDPSRRSRRSADGDAQGSSATQTAARPPDAEQMGRGVDPTEIRVGFQVQRENDVAFAGATGNPPQERQILEALVTWTNDTGGLAGRRLVPIYYEADAVGRPYDTDAQASCARFTEDHEVFAVHSSPVGGSDALVACLAARRVPLIEQTPLLFDHAYYERYAGYLYQPGWMSPDRWGVAYVNGLAQSGYFDGAKVGIVRFDDAPYRRLYENVISPRLSSIGVRPEEAVIASPSGTSDFGSMNAQANNAILRFRQEGVTHVMIIDGGGALTFFFMQQAEGQGWRPRYGLTSANMPATQASNQAVAQLSNAIGVGWSPSVDVFAADQPGGKEAWSRCQSIMEAHRVPRTYRTFTRYTDPLCDSVFFLRTALERADALTDAGLRSAAEGLGTSYVSPFTFGTMLGPGRYDGASTVRTFQFDVECRCFRYVGTTRTVS